MAQRMAYWRTSVLMELVGGAILMLAVIGGLLAWRWYNGRAYDRDAALASLVQSSQSIALAADDLFDAGMSLGLGLASDDDVKSLDPAQFQPLLVRQAALHPQFRDLAVFDLNGAVLGRSASASTVTENVSERGFFQRVTQSGTATTIREVDRGADSAFGTGVAVPIHADAGSLIGVLALTYDLPQFEARLSRVTLRTGQSLTLLDPTGRVAILIRDSAQPSATLSWEQRDRSHVPEVQAALQGQMLTSTSLAGIVDGSTRLGAFVPTTGYGWVVVATWAETDALASSRSEVQQDTLVFIAVVAAMLLGISIAAQRFVLPIRRLTMHMDRLGEDDFEPITDLASGNEIGRLAQAFNRMGNRLRQSLIGLRSERLHLQRVLEYLPVGVIEVSASGRNVTHINTLGKRFWPRPAAHQDRYDPNDPIPAFHLDGRPMLSEERPLGRTLRTGETIRGEEVLLRIPDAPEYVLRMSTTPIRDADGHVESAVMTIEDVTEQRRAERLSQQHDEALRAMFKQFPGAIGVLDREGRFILAVVPEHVRVAVPHGIKFEGRTIEEVFPPERAVIVRERFVRALAGETVLDEERAGDQYYSMISSPIRGANGAIDRVMVTRLDVTERRRAEAALHQSNELLQTAFDQFPGSLSVIDSDLRFVTALGKAGHLRLQGAALDGRSLDEALSGTQLAIAKQRIRQALNGQTIVANGELWGDRTYNLVVAPFRDANGRVSKAMVLRIDVTEQQRAQAALRERDLLLNAIVDQFPATISVIDRSYQLIMLGGKRAVTRPDQRNEDLIGRALADLLPPDRYEPYRRQAERAFAGEPLVEDTFRGDRTLRITTVPLRNNLGFIDKVMNVVVDVTEQQRLEAALRERDLLLNVIVDQFPAAIAVIDRDYRIVMRGGEQHTLRDLTSDEIVGRQVQTLMSSQDFDAYRFLAERVFAGEPQRFEHMLEGRALRGSMTPLRNAAGEIDRFLNVAYDVTDEMTRAAQSARDEKLRALGQMAGGIAHDLNQALTLVAGYGELARDSLNCEDAGPHPACDMIRIMERAAYDGGETVKRLLTFARGETQDDARKPVEVDQLLHEVELFTAPRWRDTAQASGRRVRLQVDAPPGLVLYGSHAGLREALTNLVFNAIDAMPDGGTISLSARSRDGRIIIDVADTGTGMSPEVKARVFEPFFTTKGSAGTGLGLAMVFGIVEAHQGTIDVSSEVGHGTTFHLILPILEPPAAAVLDSVTEAASRTSRVLVVDDEVKLGNLLVGMLTRDGHEAVSAPSAETALELLSVQRFDLIISDLSMGDGLNGWDLAAAVAASPHPVPVVLATGWGAGIDLDEARARGVSTVVAKPYRRPDIRAALGRVLAETED